MISFFLKRRVVTNLITIFIICIGAYQFASVRREAFPQVSFDWVSIETPYPSASPEEVEKLVTNPIEEQLRGVDGVEKVMSYSLENLSRIFIQIDEDLEETEKSRVIDDIRQAVNRTQDLPEESEESLVEEMTWDEPLITLSVAGGSAEARDRFAEELADVIEDVPGVSRADQTGDLAKEIWVELDREKLNRYRLTTIEVANTINEQNVDASAGSVEIGGEEVWVRVLNSAQDAAGVGSIILRGNDERSYLRVRDVAEVVERFEEPRLITKANGLPAIHVGVRKKKSGDTIDLADAVRRIKARMEPRAKEMGLSLIVSEDVSFFVRRRLHVMTNNLIQGGILILGALFIFLDWRLALVAAMGVPISIMASFAVSVPLGFTINLMSLLAFIIVLGMLDDDSVVVAENIYRHMEMGKPPLQAAVDGSREVVLPVLAAISVSCCGFLPFALMTGVMGKILIMIPMIVIIAFLASAFEAFFMLPAHVVELMPLGRPVEERSDGRWYARVLRTYRSSMGWILDHRGKFFLILLGFLVFTVGLAALRVRFVLFPGGLVDQFFAELEMPRGTNLTATEENFRSVERLITALPPSEFEAVTTLVGGRMVDASVRLGTQYAQARVFLTPEDTRERKTEEIISDLRRQAESLNLPGKLVFKELPAGPPVGKPVDFKIRGKDLNVVRTLIDQAVERLRQTPGVTDIQDTSEGGKDEIQVRLNDREAGFAGLTARAVAQTIFFAVDGNEASKIRRRDEVVDIRVRLQEDQRSRPEELLNLLVQNDRGQPVVLGAVASIDRRPGVPFIEHFNFRPAVQVTAELDSSKATANQVATDLTEWFKRDVQPSHPAYELTLGGEAEETVKSLNSLKRAFFIALGLDYVILAAIFASYVQPLIIILLTVPIGLMGVVYALILHGKPASFMALLGVVAMTGVVINNAIVLVNFINERRGQGASPRDAAIEAGTLRLRPIWASSITTLLGLFPTAYGFGGYEPFVAPMALALAWGLTFAMPMTIFLIPMAYVLLNDLSNWSSRWTQPLRARLLGGIRRLTGGTERKRRD